MIGTSVAYHLAAEGWDDVVLLERDRLTSGTTWHAAGLMVTFGSMSQTSTRLRQYTRDLYSRLEAETGQSTGFAPVGFIEVAADPGRLEEYRRVSAFNRHCGIDVHELTPREVGEMWPLARTDDLLAGFYVAEDGRANPVDVTMALAKGARMRGVRIIEGTPVTSMLVDHPGTPRARVRGVRTERGDIECEVVVNCAGMWARQLGRAERRRAAAAGGRALLPDHRRDRRGAPRAAGAGGPGHLRLHPRGDRRPDGRPVRGPRGTVAGRPGAGRFLLRSDHPRLGPDGPLRRGGDESGAGHPGRRDPHLLLRAGVIHARPRAAVRGGARGRELLRGGGPELDRHPHRRRDRPGPGALDRGRGARRRHHRHGRRAAAAVPDHAVLPARPDGGEPRPGLRLPLPEPGQGDGARSQTLTGARTAGGRGGAVPGRVGLGGGGLVRRGGRRSAHLGVARPGSGTGPPSTAPSARPWA